MLSISDLKKGTVFKHTNEPFQVLSYSHSHMGRGGATVRVKARGLISGSVLELSFKGNDKIEEADLTRAQADYLYKDEHNAYFMEHHSYEQFSLPIEQIEDQLDFLKEGAGVDVLIFEGKHGAISLPIKMEFIIEQTEPAVKGDTAQGSVTKPATLETGATIQVPIFVKNGDVIRVNTENREYVERVNM
ncbi:MAG TPA: elongation factor P [Patescibacteria group bacterium]|nr:elongation factor P [Patescibacteria group bacterium]